MLLRRLRPVASVLALFSCLFAVAASVAQAQQTPQQPSGPVTLFENVRVFDGSGSPLSEPTNVLVRGNQIEKITTAPIPVDRMATTTIINGGGRTLMPGLIDAHWHAMLIRLNPVQSIHGGVGFSNLAAGAEATDTLMRGFTTVRDVGGPVFDLKQAIDTGIIQGPRIFPSGAMITVTSGHGDFRQMSDLPRTIGSLTRMEQIGGAMVADSPDEVRLRVREQLDAGRVADQADGRRRRVVAAQSAGRHHLHRARTARCGGSRRQLGHLRHHSRIYARSDPALGGRRGEVHRARLPDG